MTELAGVARSLLTAVQLAEVGAQHMRRGRVQATGRSQQAAWQALRAAEAQARRLAAGRPAHARLVRAPTQAIRLARAALTAAGSEEAAEFERAAGQAARAAERLTQR